MPISRDDARELLAGLVAIDSINPSLVPGAEGEGKIARYVAAWLRDAGIEAEIHEVLPDRPNVIARVPGRRGGRSLILNAHMDTVSIAGMADPFSGRVEGDRLYGRGAYDMKGGLAAIMLAARQIKEAGGADGDLIVTAVMDEEYASAGTEAVVQSIHADGAIVTEPTGLRICAAHKGFAWLAIETAGRAAHGSKPDLGIDAIAHMGRVLGDIEAIGRALTIGSSHPLLGTGSIHASLIKGGQEVSSYPDRCRLQVERRTISGETRESVLKEVTDRLAARGADDPDFHAEAELFFWRDPFEVAADAPIVQAVQESARGILGKDPDVYGDTPWMDAALLAAAGIETVVFGPGGAGAHATTEYGSIREVALCAEILADAAMRYCAGR